MTCLFVSRRASERHFVPLRFGTLWARYGHEPNAERVINRGPRDGQIATLTGRLAALGERHRSPFGRRATISNAFGSWPAGLPPALTSRACSSRTGERFGSAGHKREAKYTDPHLQSSRRYCPQPCIEVPPGAVTTAPHRRYCLPQSTPAVRSPGRRAGGNTAQCRARPLIGCQSQKEAKGPVLPACTRGNWVRR